jgi:hypothetical protein
MPTKEPSFSERCRQMREAAAQLLEISAIVNDEAIRMAAAEGPGEHLCEIEDADASERLHGGEVVSGEMVRW